MDLFKMADARIKRLDWKDMACTKIAVFFFALMAAKLYAPILDFEWYTYAVIWLIFAAMPMMSFFKGK